MAVPVCVPAPAGHSNQQQTRHGGDQRGRQYNRRVSHAHLRQRHTLRCGGTARLPTGQRRGAACRHHLARGAVLVHGGTRVARAARRGRFEQPTTRRNDADI